jgi:enoyl-CoA hydratase/carnithine racemase
MQSLITSRLSKQTAHEACVTGRRYGGELALQKCIVDQAEAEADVLPKALELAKSLAGKDRATLGAIKRNAYAHVSACLKLDQATLG